MDSDDLDPEFAYEEYTAKVKKYMLIYQLYHVLHLCKYESLSFYYDSFLLFLGYKWT